MTSCTTAMRCQGALSGLTRVRQFQQDERLPHLSRGKSDCGRSYGASRSSSSTITRRSWRSPRPSKFATRPEVRIGSDELWDKAESALRAALDAAGLPYGMKPGDAAFYGPKIDFDVTDSIGRAWQVGHDSARLQRAGAVRPGRTWARTIPRIGRWSFIGR